MQGFFLWSDQHWVSFTYWAPGEPNNHAGFKEDCVEILHEVRAARQTALATIRICREGFPLFPNNSKNLMKVFTVLLPQTGRWNDAACTILNAYVCKMAKGHYPPPSVAPTQYGCPSVSKNTNAHSNSKHYDAFFILYFTTVFVHVCVSGLGCVRLLLLLGGGDSQDLARSQGVLCSTGQLLGARWRHVSPVFIAVHDCSHVRF